MKIIIKSNKKKPHQAIILYTYIQCAKKIQSDVKVNSKNYKKTHVKTDARKPRRFYVNSLSVKRKTNNCSNVYWYFKNINNMSKSFYTKFSSS